MTDAEYESGDRHTHVGHVIEDGGDIDVYAARGSGRKAMGEVPIGKRGWLGNPYTLEDADSRAACIEAFKGDFIARLKQDTEFRDAVADLSGKTLGCFCQTFDEEGPACHAEVIAEHADRLASGEATA